jgi:hypothetical protein
MSTVVQSKTNFQLNSTGGNVPSLDSSPGASNLVLAIVAVDKSSGTAIQAPTGFTRHTEYFNTSISAALASATGATPGNFTWTTARDAMFAVAETDIFNAAAVAAVTYPNPKTDTSVTSISGDLGTTSVSGTVFAIVAVDSMFGAWGNDPAVYTPSFSGGYTVVVNRRSNANGEPVGLPGVILAKKDVAVGASTALTVSWADSPGSTPSDQATLQMVLFEHAPAPTQTLNSAWLGVDTMILDTSGNAGEQVRVAVSTSPAMTSPIYTALVTPDAQGITRHTLPALTAGATYYYRAERGGVPIGTAQQFTKPPTTGGFTFGFAACRSESSGAGDGAILDNLRTRNPALFIETGDFHYRDITSNTTSLFRDAYDALFTKAPIAAILRQIPTAYMWSDHDFCGDNSDGTATARPAAQAVYRERVPHPTLPSASGGIYHTFRVGRVRFVLLDTRSYRSPSAATDNTSKTMLGAEQKTWLQGLLNAPDTPLTFLVSPEGWIGTSGAGVDHWGAYQTERTTLAGWITAASTRVVFLCGDAHMLAIDNGTNAAAGVHVWHAAPINQANSTKGGPYSGGTYTAGRGYGLVTVTDDGITITATFAGIQSDGTTWNTDTVTATAAGTVRVRVGGVAQPVASLVRAGGVAQPFVRSGT